MMEKQAIAVASKIAKIRKIRRRSSPVVETIDAMILATLLGRLLETPNLRAPEPLALSLPLVPL
jgi:hypothetical protein